MLQKERRGKNLPPTHHTVLKWNKAKEQNMGNVQNSQEKIPGGGVGAVGGIGGVAGGRGVSVGGVGVGGGGGGGGGGAGGGEENGLDGGGGGGKGLRPKGTGELTWVAFGKGTARGQLIIWRAIMREGGRGGGRGEGGRGFNR